MNKGYLFLFYTTFLKKTVLFLSLRNVMYWNMISNKDILQYWVQ